MSKFNGLNLGLNPYSLERKISFRFSIYSIKIQIGFKLHQNFKKKYIILKNAKEI